MPHAPHLLLAWKAFDDLHRTRAIAEHPASITYAEMVAYLDLHGVQTLEYRIAVADLIRALDDKWVEVMRKEVKKNREDNGRTRQR